MEIQGHLIQARFIEIHQVLAKKEVGRLTFLTDIVDGVLFGFIERIHSKYIPHSGNPQCRICWCVQCVTSARRDLFQHTFLHLTQIRKNLSLGTLELCSA